ncbi:hypothetical protein A3K29_03090 [Candidatus Collierbacteria bacterium RIFOXYB2_FULL_46_14]|uniref:Uncharacterized protein n=1 Tax=Candidatus Collierbacteria bacterium GW2011_GWA2_46_26 TaxID=1618381 RepID=A0A0G1SKJ8_9BACT|nr:MAG: hypothetical protein UW29_C0004G0124 [Candidatus Collierbacteria bacterium GW2011_GWC2_44_13]KKU33825.1 MAG: hypothetical protein UX47_C0001G0108 [Candidatus Collierbacteria bacterium GW2011_GWA2_46_26]OGD73106.1 MAG: hypothetical protein A3K29_03090 [Candidatus Collierbacteria bacterium RIFOXYB2_FULL_46_14]OGD76148.1 MAG: hypothetical protein A3K43_03090 [Candidatus Collierbacteria bacterium RIFOXYA2_FULL_46_20]OGD77484.1 MAG: hypothetical protein A3K39_03090 [Candidatus Collierbacteri
MLIKKPTWPFLILVLAVILRFSGYFDRLNVSVDQGRDALIGLESLRLYRAPLLGPPSSSWGFNFGPLYYYVIIFFTILIPGIFSPWIGFTLLSTLSVFLAYLIGVNSRGKTFGVILSLVTAISFAEIVNSANLLNTSLVSFAVFLSFYSASAYFKTQRKKYLLLLGFGVALAVHAHLQAMPILVLLFSPVFLTHGKRIGLKLGTLIGSFAGFLLGMTPIIIFEIQHHLAWTKSLIDYATFGQYRFYAPVRWLTDLTVFWPSRFGEVLWGNSALGLYLAVFAFVSIVFFTFRKKIDKVSLLTILVFIIEVFSIRNYRGPRSPEYLIFTHFFIIYLVSLAITLVIEGRKVLTVLACFIILSAGFYFDRNIYSQRSQSEETTALYDFINNQIGKPVSFYVLSGSYENAYSLYYFLSRSGLISESGYPVALCDNGDKYGLIPDRCPASDRLFSTGRYVLFDYRPENRQRFTSFEVGTVDQLRLYRRTYNNYELIKY